MTDTHDIPEDDDVRRLRHRAEYSLRASRMRRHERRSVQDRFSDVAILVVVASIVIALLVAALVGAGDAPAAPQNAAGRGEAVRSMVDVHTEASMVAVCPAPRAMTRRVCVRWLRVAQCETGDPADRVVTAETMRRIRWRYNGGSGFDGGLQFSGRTWTANVGRIPARRLTRAQHQARRRGAYREAHGAPAAVQILAADELRRRPDGGMGHWPTCGARW